MMPSELHDEICAVHQEFHRIAAEILQKIRDKHYAEAKQDIALEGPLNQTSIRLRSLLVKLSFKDPRAEGVRSADTGQVSAAQGNPESPASPAQEE
jgi:hypothetical protein